MTTYEISEADLLHNIAVVRRRAGVPVWGVVKYDGYGVGLCTLADLLRRQGVTRFAVSTAAEACALREGGFVREDILLLSPQPTDAARRAGLDAGCIFSVGSREEAEVLLRAAKPRGVRPRVHVAVDTGMGRFGFLPEDYAAIRALYRRGDLAVEGIYSHFSAACRNTRETARQFQRFTALLSRLETDGVARGMAHIANSPGLFRYSGMELDAVRVGSALVGRVAGTDPRRTGLRPVGTLVTTVCAVRTLPKGARAGYHGEARIRRDTALAVLAAGRRQGIAPPSRLERLRGQAPAAAFGTQRARLLVTQSESHAAADVTGLAVRPGDTARIDLSPLRVPQEIRRVVR